MLLRTDIMMSNRFLDVNANYRINDKLSIFAEGKNLTNQPLRYYQGTFNQELCNLNIMI